MITKICTKCEIEKPIDAFWNDITHKDSKSTRCKECANSIRRENRKQNPEKYGESDKEHYEKYKESYSRQSKNRYLKNRKQIIKRINEWRKNNPEKTKIYRSTGNAKRRSTIKGKLQDRMNTRIRYCLTGDRNSKSLSNLVGYSLDQLKKHLQKTILNGYSWKDFMNGQLDIDHKIPVSVFNFEKPENIDFKKCWALKNLQLLPSIENRRKGAKLTKPFQPSLAFGI